ncbi:MAG: hypothetical protein BWY52_02070 [Chloroflexi bacterium ADurb.Bin325]|nr:MAG: hypothetical protein BWY52_02070 [Chloroflexi bacterium ADurb.Bin325]
MPCTGGLGTLSRGRSAFHAARAVIAAEVSKVCGSSSWPGMLITRVPASTRVSRGAPGAVSTVKARCVLAASAGLSS